jgi:hypothetical protein
MVRVRTRQELEEERTQQALEALYPRVAERLADIFRERGTGSDREIDHAVWRPVARSCVLALMRAVLAHLATEDRFEADCPRWVGLVWEQPGSWQLPRRMVLRREDTLQAVQVAARELLASRHFGGRLRFGGVPLLVVTTGEHIVVNRVAVCDGDA